jgi:hypothetical protein
MDPKLAGNDQLDEALLRRLQRTAVFVCVLRRGIWTRSGVTASSRRSPVRTIHGSACKSAGRAGRAKLLVSDLPVEAHPEVMRGVAGYRFVSVEPGGGVRRFRRTEERAIPTSVTGTSSRTWLETSPNC